MRKINNVQNVTSVLSWQPWAVLGTCCMSESEFGTRDGCGGILRNVHSDIYLCVWLLMESRRMAVESERV